MLIFCAKYDEVIARLGTNRGKHITQGDASMQKQRARAIALTIAQDQTQTRLRFFAASAFAAIAFISIHLLN